MCLKSATNVLLIVFKVAEIKTALNKAGVKIPPNESNTNTGTSVVSMREGSAWNGKDTLSMLWPIHEGCKLQMETLETDNAETQKTPEYEKAEVPAPPGSLVLIFELVRFDAPPDDRYMWTRFGTLKVPALAEEA